MSENVVKKYEDIEKSKEDLATCEKFDQIYSNFSEIDLSPRIPKVIVDEKLTAITSFDHYLEYDPINKKIKKEFQTKSGLKKNISNLKKQQNKKSNKKNNENKNEKEDPNFSLIKHFIKWNKDFLRKHFDDERKRKKLGNNGINTINKNKKNNNELKKSKSMTSIKKTDITNKSLQNIQKTKFDVKNPFERLYNQGF